MSGNNWENYLTAPIERYHSDACREFHEGAEFESNEKTIDGTRYINGIEFNRLLARFKTKIMKTYKIKSDAIYSSSPIKSKVDRVVLENEFYELMSKEPVGLEVTSPDTYKKLKGEINEQQKQIDSLTALLREACDLIRVADKDFRIELGSRFKPFEGRTTYNDFLNRDDVKEIIMKGELK